MHNDLVVVGVGIIEVQNLVLDCIFYQIVYVRKMVGMFGEGLVHVNAIDIETPFSTHFLDQYNV